MNKKNVLAIITAAFLVLAAVVVAVGMISGGNFIDTPHKDVGMPDTPDTPDVPNTPDVPDTPDTPDEPNVPDEPDVPDEPVEPEIPEDTVISFIAAGDNIVHESMYNDAVEKMNAAGADTSGSYVDFAYVYKNIAELVASKDLAFINVETLIGGDEYGYSGYPNFNSPESMGQLLCDMGFDVMNLAHNHMLDAPSPERALYLINSDKFFTERGKTAIGYYKNYSDCSNIRYTEVEGIKIAWLAYTYEDEVGSQTLNGHSVGRSTAYIPFFNKELASMQVAIAKQNADLIFVSAHWGVEDSWSATDSYFPLNDIQKEYSQYFADLGVDVIIGTHPHVIQDTAWLEGENGNKTLCAYSLGNLISGMYWGRNMLGALLEFDIVKNGVSGEISIENVAMIPTVSQYSRRDNGAFRDFEIILFEDYTEELAAAHGCHAKDDTIAKRGMKFSHEALAKKISRTFDEEFIKNDEAEEKPDPEGTAE